MKARHKDTGEIIELAEEGIVSRDGRHFCWYQVELIPEPIDECEPSLPSNLDEAALKAYPKMSRLSEPHGVIPADNKTHYLGDANEENRAAFKVGAEWMAGQGITVGGTFRHSCGYPSVIELNTYLRDYDGKEVIVQIQKKEE